MSSVIRDALPESCHKQWDAMNSHNFLVDFSPEVIANVGVWKEHNFQPLFNAKTTQYAYEEWNPREGDVFVVAFPKTGLNWMTEITKRLLYHDDEASMKLMLNLPPQLALFEGGSPEKFTIWDNLPFKRRQVSTHLPATMMNVVKIKKANAKVIYVLRNPKDQAVSWFKFVPKLPFLQIPQFESIYPKEWNEFFNNYVEGKMYLGMKKGEWYPEHILSWLEHRDDKNVMFVYYEDLMKDLNKEITRIAQFLDVNRSEKELSEITEKCTFSSMKSAESNDQSSTTQMRKAAGILRKGGYGGWKEHFTVAQSERMDKIFKEKFGDTNIKFTYE